MVCTPVLLLTAGLAQAQTANVTTQSFNDTRQGGLIDRTAIPERRAVSPEMRGDIYMARKMFREAVDMYRQMPPDSAISWNKTGIAFHQMLDLESARRSYERSLKLNPKYPGGIEGLTKLLQAGGHTIVKKGKRYFVEEFATRVPAVSL